MSIKTNQCKYLIRLVKQNDMESVIELLQSLSKFKPKKSDYLTIWNDFSKQSNIHSLVLLNDKKVVGYGSIIIETKIRGGKMGHIEDIVIHPHYRKMGLGKLLLNALFDIAKEKNCYKTALQCKENNLNFYTKCGYVLSGSIMQKFYNKIMK